MELERLVEVAKVQSVESSNRIEGIVTSDIRIRQIVREKTTPKNRDEKEIAGYRDLMKYSESGLGGRYRVTQNYLKETRPDGTEFIHLTMETDG